MSEEAPAAPGTEPVGSLAEEAFKLFRAVSTPAGATSSDHVCSTPWCPVCQVVGFVRSNPEAVASVKRSAGDLARSLRDLVDTALSADTSTTTSSEEKQ